MTIKNKKLVNSIMTFIAVSIFIPAMILFLPLFLLVTLLLRILAKILFWLGFKNISLKIHSGSAVGGQINEFLCEKCGLSFDDHKETAVCPKCEKPAKYISYVLICPAVPDDLVGRLNNWAQRFLP